MGMLGKLVHYTADAVLVSTVLAGVRRSSGFTYAAAFCFFRRVPAVLIDKSYFLAFFYAYWGAYTRI